MPNPGTFSKTHKCCSELKFVIVWVLLLQLVLTDHIVAGSRRSYSRSQRFRHKANF